MNAHLTNAVSNALHAMFLLAYFFGALRLRVRGRGLRGEVVAFFGVLLVLKLLGVWVHYAPEEASPGWTAISLLVVLLNYLLIRALNAPWVAQGFVVVLSLVSCWLFLAGDGNFLFIAGPIVLVYLVAAFYSRSTLRAGFLMAVASNVIWIAARQVTAILMGHEVPSEARYDNDIFHLMLIASTYVIYRGFSAQARPRT
jgi:hypothetical protein